MLMGRRRAESEEEFGKAAWIMQEHEQARGTVPDQKGAEL